MKIRFMSVFAIVMLAGFWSPALGLEPIQFGVKAGLSVSTLNLDREYPVFDTRLALAGGGFLIVDLPGVLAFQTEVLYVPKGASEKNDARDESGDDLGEVTRTWRVNYLEIPLLARISLGSAPVHVLAGCAFGFRQSSKITLDDYPAVLEDYSHFSSDDQDWEEVADNDFGLVLGIGAGLPTAFGELVVDARYTWGQCDIYLSDWKNRNFLVMVGVAF